MSSASRLGTAAVTKPRALVRQVRETMVALVGPLGERARRESRRRRLVWIAIAALLVLVPLFFNLVRAPDFKASVELFPTPVAPYPAIVDPAYYRSLLSDPELRRQMQLNVGQGVADYRDVTIGPNPPRSPFAITVAASTPHRAQEFVNALAPQIANATRRQLARLVTLDAVKVQDRLSTRLSRADRRSLRRQLRRLGRLTRFGPYPPGRVLLGRPAPAPRIDRWADRLVADLPGDFPGRPNPLWAALAGLLVAATLWAISLVLLPPGGRRADAPLPQPD